MSYILLWTDLFIYLLLLLMFFFVCWCYRHTQIRNSWQHVIRSCQGIITLLILLTFILIGILDSIHFKTALLQYDHNGYQHKVTQVYSLLDIIVQPLGQEYEKTYSAPFSRHLYSKTLITTVQGKTIRTYPSLRYIKLGDPSKPVIVFIMKACGKALCFTLAVILLVLMFFNLKRYHKLVALTGVTTAIFHSIKDSIKVNLVAWITLFMLLWLVSSIALLAQHCHVLGTDKIGHDVLYQCIKSIRTGLVIGTLSTFIMLPFALLCGLMAGYFGGLVDDIIQYIYTTLSSIPGVLLIAAAVLALQMLMQQHPTWFDSMSARADARLLALCAILGLTGWTSLCRLLRGECLKLREADYVQAAKVLGVSHFKILIRHLLPNVLHIILITVVLDFSGLVLAEAVLSYVGVGVDPATLSWGNMINSARLELARDPIIWWPLLSAFVFMFSLVLAANLFSDVLRDAFDPRFQQ